MIELKLNGDGDGKTNMPKKKRIVEKNTNARGIFTASSSGVIVAS